LPFNTTPLSDGDQILFSVAQKGMGGGHEMTIRTRGGKIKRLEKVEKGNKNKGKFWRD